MNTSLRVLSLVLLCTACAKETVTCQSPGGDWVLGGKDHFLHSAQFAVKVKEDSRVSIEGNVLSLQEFRHQARRLSDMSPEPIFILSYDKGASCSQVKAVQDVMEAELNCRAGSCVYSGGS